METSFSYAEIIRAEDIRKDKKAAISNRGHNRKEKRTGNQACKYVLKKSPISPMVSFQHADTRQIDHTEVVRFLPVERTAVADEDMLVMQQVKRELLIGMDVELLHIDLREDVERRFRFDRSDAWNIVEHVVHQLALIVDAAAGHDNP